MLSQILECHDEGIQEADVQERRLWRDSIPREVADLDREEQLDFIVGIGGHHATPNARIFSYVLPAIELAQRLGTKKKSLILTSSLGGALKYNYGPGGNREINRVHYNTRSKIALIEAFVQEFFPAAFSEVKAYYGHIQEEIPEKAWLHIWEEIAKVNPQVCKTFLGKLQREDGNGTKAYAVRHAFWFLDQILKDDSETSSRGENISVSVGSENEAYFNAIRRAVLRLSLDFLEETLGQSLIRRDRILQLIFPTCNPVPYGEALKGKKRAEYSAEIELHSGKSPFDYDDKLLADVTYTVNTLQRLTGATREEFLAFWKNLNSN